MAKFAVILPAAGRSSRFRDREKKPFADLDGRPVWMRVAELFVTRPDVCQTIIVIAPGDLETFRRRSAAHLAFMGLQIAEGGAERGDSVANALALVKPDADHVAIHDAARPCVTEEMISAVFAKAEATGAAMLAVPVSDTVKRADGQHRVEATVPRKGLWLAQTPQAFRRDWLLAAYMDRQAAHAATDDAQLIADAGHAVFLVEGSATNIKVTTKGDLILAEAVLRARPRPKPVGPAHPFADEEMWGGRGLK